MPDFDHYIWILYCIYTKLLKVLIKTTLGTFKKFGLSCEVSVEKRVYTHQSKVLGNILLENTEPYSALTDAEPLSFAGVTQYDEPLPSSVSVVVFNGETISIMTMSDD